MVRKKNLAYTKYGNGWVLPQGFAVELTRERGRACMMIATVANLIVRRLLAAIPILLIVSALLFCVLRLLPVDPAAMSLPPNATTEEIAAQHAATWASMKAAAAAIFDLASCRAARRFRPLHRAAPRRRFALVAQTLPATIQLATCAMVIAAILEHWRRAVCCFTCAARCSEPVADLVSIVLLSIPEFLWGLILLFVFGVLLQWLPFTGQVSPGLPLPHVTGFLLLRCASGRPLRRILERVPAPDPARAGAGLAFSPAIMRVLRSSLLDVYHEDYIQQARLRGLSEGQILLGHAFKNAALPTLTLAGVQFGILFSGTLLVEVIYSYPGMGNLMVDAVRNADLPLIQAIGLTYCIVVLLINTAVDSLYVVLNPKLRVR